jgi:hypothetical protein
MVAFAVITAGAALSALAMSSFLVISALETWAASKKTVTALTNTSVLLIETPF